MIQVLCQSLVLALGVVGAATAQSARLSTDQETTAVSRIQLRGLDTLNGSAEDIYLTAGDKVSYGHLEIAAEACLVPRANPVSDAFAFLRIKDIREETPRFSGWMFASSPALSALDHPRYDVWVISCSS